jgi:cysteinyl-tRNA synthetase
MSSVLGVGGNDPTAVLEQGKERFLLSRQLSRAYVHEKIAQRDAARRRKDFALADQIREELRAQGIVLEDTPSGTVWKVAR